jgi:predicted DCC family thiol-disulfide oxidoreductase YuxK
MNGRSGSSRHSPAEGQRQSPQRPLTIYVDDACPLCHAEMSGLAARDRGRCLRLLDCSVEGFRDVDSEAAGLDQDTLMHRIHARDADGRWLVGVPVFAAAYEAAGLHWLARLLRVGWLGPLWNRGYSWVVDHRQLLVRAGAPRLLRALLASPRS